MYQLNSLNPAASSVVKKTMPDKSSLQLERINIVPEVPPVLQVEHLAIQVGDNTTAAGDADAIKEKFPLLYGQPVVTFAASPTAPEIAPAPLKIGVVLSGGQAPGGHNVIAGLFDVLMRVSPASVLYGFSDGPKGIFTSKYVEIDAEFMSHYRNQGGFDMIGSGRDKIEKPEQFAASLETSKALDLDGIIVIGGDDSNTNACMLGEYFASQGAKCVVVGAPKTIDGDLKSEAIETSFGFDTACRTYAELIGNLQHDALASRKYYHFVRLMGRSASHITLECALQTCPNFSLIGEEEEANCSTLNSIVTRLCNMVVSRSASGKDFGTILVPEGLIEFVPEVGTLISEINEVLAAEPELGEAELLAKLSENSATLFQTLPAGIRQQLLLDRDPHGNVQVAKIETEALLIDMIETELTARKAAGEYSGKFQPQAHYFGYEGRCALPTPFDCSYCYALGCSAAILVQNKFNGYISCVSNTEKSIAEWQCGGTPLTSLMNMERRTGKDKPVIKKALTELDGPVFAVFKQIRDFWMSHDAYRTPGPIQFNTESAMHERPYHLVYERGGAVRKEHTEEAALEVDQGRVLNYSALQLERLEYVHELPAVLQGVTCVATQMDRTELTEGSQHLIAALSSERACVQPKLGALDGACAIASLEGAPYAEPAAMKVGVVFMGRQTPGGHDAIGGMYDALKKHHSDSQLLAFVGGSSAMFRGEYKLVDHETKATCEALNLDALVLLGGTLSMTHASNLAEWFTNEGVSTKVLGIPCGVDGNMKSERVETAFGFDTASKVYSQLVGNIETDCASAKKYWYFIKLMGRQPSHLALECSLQAHPNVTLIGEEARAMHWTLQDVVMQVADTVQQRRAAGKNYGVALIPEGFFASLSDIRLLINDVKSALDQCQVDGKEFSDQLLPPWSRQRYATLPEWLQKQMLQFDESSGELNHSQIQGERLMAELVSEELAKRKESGTYLGGFNPVCHFFGYQARSAMPSHFDSTLAYTLGYTSIVLAATGQHAMVPNCRCLAGPIADWRVEGLPLVDILSVVQNHDGVKAEVPSAPVDLRGKAMRELVHQRKKWEENEDYANPGPVQYEGAAAKLITLTLQQEGQEYARLEKSVETDCMYVLEAVRAGLDEKTVGMTASMLNAIKLAIEGSRV